MSRRQVIGVEPNVFIPAILYELLVCRELVRETLCTGWRQGMRMPD